jgi:DNA repair protein RecO
MYDGTRCGAGSVMNARQQITTAIVLTRTDYGEADRILTLLTPDHGKLRLMAKGVRRIKSRLAGGIEIFSITDITFIKGRSEIGMLVSARLQIHYGHIVQDLDRTMLGYELMKQLHKVTEDELEAEYFEVLHQAFAALDDPSISLGLVRLWFSAQLLRLSGHTPNLVTEPDGTKLTADQAYEFSFDDSSFVTRPGGPYNASAIKFLRLIFSGNQPQVLAKVQGNPELVTQVLSIVMSLRQLHLRIG